MSTFARRRTVIPPTPPSTPRLRLGPSQPRRHLDGAWWPRSSDPVAELPGLILAIDHRNGPITRVMLGHSGWDSHPLRMAVAGRLIRLGWFTSMPAGLLTAICRDRDRVDLLVIPPATDEAEAEVAMALALEATNVLRTPQILRAADLRRREQVSTTAHSGWESDGGAG
jgi:Family of unknown function (DUF5994)